MDQRFVGWQVNHLHHSITVLSLFAEHLALPRGRCDLVSVATSGVSRCGYMQRSTGYLLGLRQLHGQRHKL